MTLQLRKAFCETRPIKGFEGLYEINKGGAVKRLGKGGSHQGREYFLKLQKNKQGYPMIMLHKNGSCKGFSVHRLVAKAFIPNPENKPTVNHKNGVKDDNRFSNLEWMTYKENNQHAEQNRLINHAYGTRVGGSKLKDKQVRVIKYLKNIKPKIAPKKIAEIFKVDVAIIHRIQSGKIWKHIKI